MNFRLRALACATMLLPFLPVSAEATVITWDFSIKVDSIIRDNANVIDDSIVAGSILNGSFSYDDGLTDSSPGNTYVDRYNAVNGTFSINGLGVNPLDVEVSVVHQSSRDIVDIVGEYNNGNIWEEFELGFLDYTQSYGSGVLPINWANPPVNLADIEFDYTYDTQSDCCYDSWLQGHVVSIQQRQVAPVSEPATIGLLTLGIAGLLRSRKRS